MIENNENRFEQQMGSLIRGVIKAHLNDIVGDLLKRDGLVSPSQMQINVREELKDFSRFLPELIQKFSVKDSIHFLDTNRVYLDMVLEERGANLPASVTTLSLLAQKKMVQTIWEKTMVEFVYRTDAVRDALFKILHTDS